MGQRLQGRTALVTSASSGFGQAAALALTVQGVKVAVVAGREDRQRDHGGERRGQAIVADFSREKS